MDSPRDVLDEPQGPQNSPTNVCDILEYVFSKDARERGEQNSHASVEQACECSICFDGVSVDEDRTELRCGHIFHNKCARPWLEKKKTCPTCRGPAFPVKEWIHSYEPTLPEETRPLNMGLEESCWLGSEQVRDESPLAGGHEEERRSSEPANPLLDQMTAFYAKRSDTDGASRGHGFSARRSSVKPKTVHRASTYSEGIQTNRRRGASITNFVRE